MTRPTKKTPPLRWLCLPYPALSPPQLYRLLRLRAEIFVVEQDCPYQDLDGLDQPALHLLGLGPEDALLAYARLLPPGTRFKEASIGRVAVAATAREQGLGKALMAEAITHCQSAWPEAIIRISAQQRLENFYNALNFTRDSEVYMEDNIPHIEMLLTPHK